MPGNDNQQKLSLTNIIHDACKAALNQKNINEPSALRDAVLFVHTNLTVKESPFNQDEILSLADAFATACEIFQETNNDDYKEPPETELLKKAVGFKMELLYRRQRIEELLISPTVPTLFSLEQIPLGIEALDQRFSKALSCPTFEQKTMDPSANFKDLDVALVKPNQRGLRKEVRHFLNGVSAYRSIDLFEQNSLLGSILQSNYDDLDFSNPNILANALGLFIDSKLSRYQFETLINIYYIYHMDDYDQQHKLIASWKVTPTFHPILDNENEFTEEARSLLFPSFADGFFARVQPTPEELEQFRLYLLKIPASERYFYQFSVPKGSATQVLINSGPLELTPTFKTNNIMTQMTTGAFHAIGFAMFPDSYVPCLSRLGEITTTQVMNAMDNYSIRYKAAHLPGCNVQPPTIPHFKRMSIAGIYLHDDYHSCNATILGPKLTLIVQRIIKLIREKMLSIANWKNMHAAYPHGLNKNSCKTVWMLSERELAGYLTLANASHIRCDIPLDLRNASDAVLTEAFHLLMHLTLNSNNPIMFGKFNNLTHIGIILLIDMVQNFEEWKELGIDPQFFSHKASYFKTSLANNILKKSCLITCYKSVAAIKEYFTDDSRRNVLLYLLQGYTNSLSAKEIAELIDGTNEETMSLFQFRRNNTDFTSVLGAVTLRAFPKTKGSILENGIRLHVGNSPLIIKELKENQKLNSQNSANFS